MTVRVATFNAENLFARYRFRQDFNPILDDGFTINNLAFDIHDEPAKQITAKAIKEVDADLVCLQEVESMAVLDRFQSRYLPAMKYKHRIVIDGNDPRNIDVAILSRHPFTSFRTYRHERNIANTAFLFSRDCLEAEIDIDGKPLTLYVNHFKSMIGGRDETKERREEQVARVAKIVDDSWSGVGYQGNFIVLGDFNDYVDADTSLTSLVEHPQLVNVVNRLPEDQQWTHFFAGGNEYKQLDYILLSKALADQNPNAVPEIMRKGLPFRAEDYEGERFDNVGENHPKASDHAPLLIDIELI